MGFSSLSTGVCVRDPSLLTLDAAPLLTLPSLITLAAIGILPYPALKASPQAVHIGFAATTVPPSLVRLER